VGVWECGSVGVWECGSVGVKGHSLFPQEVRAASGRAGLISVAQVPAQAFDLAIEPTIS
jgi:hypothetical protein